MTQVHINYYTDFKAGGYLRMFDDVRFALLFRYSLEEVFKGLKDMGIITLYTIEITEIPPKKGRWYDVGSLSCRCDQCGCKNNKPTKYCPNCGAEMEQE